MCGLPEILTSRSTPDTECRSECSSSRLSGVFVVEMADTAGAAERQKSVSSHDQATMTVGVDGIRMERRLAQRRRRPSG